MAERNEKLRKKGSFEAATIHPVAVVEEIALVEQQLNNAQRQFENKVLSQEDLFKVKRELIALKRQLAAHDDKLQSQSIAQNRTAKPHFINSPPVTLETYSAGRSHGDLVRSFLQSPEYRENQSLHMEEKREVLLIRIRIDETTAKSETGR
jgi:hypothetical protein